MWRGSKRILFQVFSIKNTPLSVLQSITDKKFLRVVSQMCIQFYPVTYYALFCPHIYIKCFAHCSFSAHCNGLGKASELDGDDDDQQGTSREVQDKETDRSKFGWKAANEYEQDEFASDSADEKCIFRSEGRVETHVISSQKKLRDNFMKRNVACRYAQNNSYHENPAHKLFQGLKSLSNGRGLRQ